MGIYKDRKEEKTVKSEYNNPECPVDRRHYVVILKCSKVPGLNQRAPSFQLWLRRDNLVSVM